jgi:hypothetical protein
MIKETGRPITPLLLWENLKEKERYNAIISMVDSGSKESKETFIPSLAKAYNFRTAYVKSWPSSKVAEFTLKPKFKGATKIDSFVHLFLIYWFLSEKKNVLETFLDAQSIPHREGTIDDDYNESPSLVSFMKGIKAIQEKFETRVVGIYLGFLTNTYDSKGFWKNLTAAINKSSFDFNESLTWDQDIADIQKVQVEEQNVEENEREVQECETFTTMDNMMFRLVVDAVTEQEGSLNATQIGDVIEELISLNSERKRSLFHKGFLQSIDNQPFNLSFPGANEERRCWYMTGFIVGLARLNMNSEIACLIKDNRELSRRIILNTEIDCGRILLQSIPQILFNLGDHNVLIALVTNQINRLSPETIFKLTSFLYSSGTYLLRKNSYQEAKAYFDTAQSIIERNDDLFSDSFKAHNRRKQGQALQHKGQFAEAKEILTKLIKEKELGDKPNAQADIGLIEGNFRSLRNILPSGKSDNSPKIVSSLKKGCLHFEESIKAHGDQAINAHFCMGVHELLSNSQDNQKTCDHLSFSYGGMMKGEKYSETEFLSWNKFLLSLALTESLESSHLEHAESLYRDSRDSKLSIPNYLTSRLLNAASLFDQSGFAEFIAQDLLDSNRDEAVKLIHKSELYIKSAKIRNGYLEQLRTVKWSAEDKWKEFKELLGAALKSSEIELAEEVLDQIETLASGNNQVAEKFEKFLRKDFNYDPAWNQEEASLARIQILERLGKLEEAGNLLQELFYKVRMEEDDNAKLDALAILDRISALKIWPKEEIKALAEKIPPMEEMNLGADKLDQIKKKKVAILYVGGDEKQSKMDESIIRSIAKEYPNFEVTFVHPGWSSNWNQLLPKFKRDLSKYDGLVLSRLVRTMFGRNVREMCDSRTPWFSCTGKGRKSITRSIEGAALHVAAQN